MIDLIPSSVMARLQSSMDPKAGVPLATLKSCLKNKFGASRGKLGYDTSQPFLSIPKGKKGPWFTVYAENHGKPIRFQRFRFVVLGHFPDGLKPRKALRHTQVDLGSKDAIWILKILVVRQQGAPNDDKKPPRKDSLKNWRCKPMLQKQQRILSARKNIS